ncbi:major facilitator superfamily domain-containing protein [Coniella lustricola]|uniref:Major facilitator superfamily domain-containing protein n=1 Tax=Coniella lustricola TaxID=2025994 RepID=A0A2T2ZWZ2_9PEZI|nr:major facilitator superfamily domain-containing protein [Coniella lustricola]
MDEITVIEAASVAGPGVSAESRVVPAEQLEVSAEAPQPQRSSLRLYTILAALCLELFIGALDQTITATSAPTIAADLHNAAGYTWIGGAYLLANTAAGPIWVRCSDIWGRKPAVLTALAIFAAASVITAAATSMGMLIAGRALQGSAGGGLMQLVNIIIADLFSIRKRALYIGAMGLVWVLAGTTGPVIGGALTQYASWRWCFWINLPVCFVTFLVMLFFLDVHNPRTKLRDGLKAIDWFGSLSIVGVTVMLLLGLDFGGVAYPWPSPRVVCLITLGGLLVAVFVYSEKRLAKYPLILFSIFSSHENVLSNNAIAVVAFTHSMASFGVEYYLPLYFQAVQAATPFQSGLLLLPMIITCAAGDILGGVAIHQLGRYRELIWIGTALLTLGTGLLTLWGVDTKLGVLIGIQIVFGTGMALLFQTPTMAIQNSVAHQANTANATATISFLRNLATSLATIIGGVVFQNSMTGKQAFLKEHGVAGATLAALSGENAAANVGMVRDVTYEAQRTAIREAFAGSVRNIFVLYAAVAGVGLVAGLFVKQRVMKKEHVETKTGVENMVGREEGSKT